MALSFEDARSFLPPGLSDPQLKQLYRDIQIIGEGRNFYTEVAFEYLLQGDVTADSYYPSITESGLVEVTARVLLLSNSCDISLENTRDLPRRVAVAPVIRLERWIEMLRENGISEARLESQITALRAQRLTSYFYLPASDAIPESLVLLDQIQSIPLARLENALEKRIHILSQAGFWVLLLKLSIHFSRPLEAVVRDAQ